MNTQINKEFEIEQSIDKVWKNLANPEEIVVCVPGASITEKIDDKNYKGAVVTKFGPIKASYAGDIEIIELDEVNKKMVLKGRGLDSKGKGSADMIMNGTLTEESGKTKVNFSMDITIVGMLAQFGSRLINDVSDQLLNQFVVNFKNKLSAASDDEPASEAAATTKADAAPKEATTGGTSTNTASSTQTTSATTSAGTTAAAAASPSSTTKTSKPKPEPEIDNSLNAGSLIGTVIKSIFGGILDFFKSIFGGKRS